MTAQHKQTLTWILVVIAAIFIYNSFTAKDNKVKTLNYNEFISAVKTNQIKELTIKGQEIKGKFRDETKAIKDFTVIIPENSFNAEELRKQGITVTAKKTIEEVAWYISLLPTIIFVGIFVYFISMTRKGIGGGATGANAFGTAKAKTAPPKSKVTFEDVAGCDEAKEEVQETISFLKNPQKYSKLGGRIRKGFLLAGPPGCGKTLMARAIAGEAGVPFFSDNGSSFVEMFVGVGASRVRNLFEQAKKNKPCIIFIDEIDAVGKQRGTGHGGGNDEREQTLNALLAEMDGFEENTGIIVIAATNRPDMLDAALKRPGRFDKQIVLSNPDVNGREAILKVHTKKMPLSQNVNLRTLARGMIGFTGADIENVCNEAASVAGKSEKNEVDMESFEKAKDRVLLGAERKFVGSTPEEIKITACHESGHAILGAILPECDPIHKVTIVPRGMALGVTLSLPERERSLYSKTTLLDMVKMALGGRVAEKILIGTITQGASNDIKRATEIIRKMVTQWGMSDELGPVALEESHESIFMGRDFGNSRSCSESTAAKIDKVVQEMIENCQKSAEKWLTSYKDALDKMTTELIEKETIDGKDVLRIIRDNPPTDAKTDS